MTSFCKTFIKYQLKRLFKNYLIAINQFQTKLFVIYIKRDYSENSFEYEKILHYKRFSLFKLLEKMQKKVSQLSSDKERFQLVINQLNSLFAIVESLGSLRYRVKDQATFEVCEAELIETSKMISVAICDILVNKSVSLLDSHVMDFWENSYRSTLQVISNEPIVYVIFIQGIRELFAYLQLISNEKIV